MRENCEQCGGRAAAVTLTEVGLEGKVVRKLCALCAEELGVPGDTLPLGNHQDDGRWDELLHRISQERIDEDSLACPGCGWTFGEFESRGKLGCPQCYQTFMGDMTRLLKEFHGADRHTGKVPHKIGRRIDMRRRILGVKDNIQIAIGEERFEDAAHLRDEMRDLDAELRRLVNGSGPS